MKIIMKENPNEMDFCALGVGDLFLVGGEVFMKTVCHLYAIECTLEEMLLEGNADWEDLQEAKINAINMKTGIATYFENHNKVIQIKNAELVIHN